MVANFGLFRLVQLFEWINIQSASWRVHCLPYGSIIAVSYFFSWSEDQTTSRIVSGLLLTFDSVSDSCVFSIKMPRYASPCCSWRALRMAITAGWPSRSASSPSHPLAFCKSVVLLHMWENEGVGTFHGCPDSAQDWQWHMMFKPGVINLFGPIFKLSWVPWTYH